MSSLSFENNGWSPRSAAERVLMLLKMRGSLPAAALGRMLGTSGEAARQQLARLAEDGLVAAVSQARGVGRPAQYWTLTPAGQARFPDTHAALTVQLVSLLRDSLGEVALDSVISAREAQTLEAYRQALSSTTDLRARVEALARLRAEEGYMSDWWQETDGTLVLAENHCPICAAATACQGFCRSELDVFRQVLGPDADVRRSEHILAGARRCAYEIRAL
jgi:predicted ArsR family transcriptional regulator